MFFGVFICVVFIFAKGPKAFQIPPHPYIAIAISIGISLVCAVVVWYTNKQKAKNNQLVENSDDDEKKKDMGAEKTFVNLLILASLTVAFAHGGNDVGNAVGPFASVLMA